MAMTLEEVNTKIEALLNSPEVDYKIGEKTVSASQKLDQLIKYRKHLMEYPDDPGIEIINFNTNVNEFGEEQGEYID